MINIKAQTLYQTAICDNIFINANIEVHPRSRLQALLRLTHSRQWSVATLRLLTHATDDEV